MAPHACWYVCAHLWKLHKHSYLCLCVKHSSRAAAHSQDKQVNSAQKVLGWRVGELSRRSNHKLSSWYVRRVCLIAKICQLWPVDDTEVWLDTFTGLNMHLKCCVLDCIMKRALHNASLRDSWVQLWSLCWTHTAVLVSVLQLLLQEGDARSASADGGFPRLISTASGYAKCHAPQVKWQSSSQVSSI